VNFLNGHLGEGNYIPKHLWEQKKKKSGVGLAEQLSINDNFHNKKESGEAGKVEKPNERQGMKIENV